MQTESDMPLWHLSDPSGNAPQGARDVVQLAEQKGDISNNGPAAWLMLLLEFKKNKVNVLFKERDTR